MADDDVLTQLDPILAVADTTANPWETISAGERAGERVYVPDYGLARRLLAVPIAGGYAKKQQSGRVAKALDAWIAHELRRAGFPESAPWPRGKQPRTLAADLAEAEEAIVKAHANIDRIENRIARYAEAAAKKGYDKKPPSLRDARSGLNGVSKALPGSANAGILGRFYVKQVDVVVSTWQRGPDVLVSSKTQFSSYLNNKNNRYEEAVGEATNLRDRYPRAAMGFAFLVRTNLFDEHGAYVYLRNQLARLRKPDGPFDATMLLSGKWDNSEEPELGKVEDADENLSAPRFFEDLLNAVMDNSPVDLHLGLRLRKLEKPPKGGMPPLDEEGALYEGLDSDTAD